MENYETGRAVYDTGCIRGGHTHVQYTHTHQLLLSLCLHMIDDWKQLLSCTPLCEVPIVPLIIGGPKRHLQGSQQN